MKTSKQAATEAVTYPTVIRDIIQKDGVLGLFGRGLKTKILSNGLQGKPFLLPTVLDCPGPGLIVHCPCL